MSAFLLSESPSISCIPKKQRTTKSGTLRMEACIQTVGDINKNRRKYMKPDLQEAVNTIGYRLREGSFLGEMDHPLDDNPARQFTVLYKAVSHKFLEMGWDGNMLMSVVETLDTHHGRDLQGLIRSGVPIGFSFRGMGDLKKVTSHNESYNEVVGPLTVVTWDAVSSPSHSKARMVKMLESQGVAYKDLSAMPITEETSRILLESAGCFDSGRKCLNEKNGLICTEDGMCYLPNDFDTLVNSRVTNLLTKFK